MPWVAAIAGAALGAMGASKSSTGSATNTGVSVIDESANEKMAREAIGSNFETLQKYADLGYGQEDIKQSKQASYDLADLLKNYSTSGGLPGETENAQAKAYAESQFAPQRELLQQSFKQQQIQANQLAAQMGRSVDDPIIQAKLRESMANQSTVMGQQQLAFQSQFAQDLMGRKLGYATQFADLKGQLASQAMANRQALLQMGQGIQSQERQWRLGTAGHWSSTRNETGGNTSDYISGMMSGAGKMMGMVSGGGLGGLMGGGGGDQKMAAPAAQMPTSNDWASMMQAPGSSVPGGLSMSPAISRSVASRPSQVSGGGSPYNPAPYFLGGTQGNPMNANGYGWGANVFSYLKGGQ